MLMNRWGHFIRSETIIRIDMSSEGTINGKEKAVPDEIQKLSFLTTTTT